jgi:hypothetical protein
MQLKYSTTYALLNGILGFLIVTYKNNNMEPKTKTHHFWGTFSFRSLITSSTDYKEKLKDKYEEGTPRILHWRSEYFDFRICNFIGALREMCEILPKTDVKHISFF